MSYYDVDAILTDAQKLPCTFELDVPGLGYLDGNPGGTVRFSNVACWAKLTHFCRSRQARSLIYRYGSE